MVTRAEEPSGGCYWENGRMGVTKDEPCAYIQGAEVGV